MGKDLSKCTKRMNKREVGGVLATKEVALYTHRVWVQKTRRCVPTIAGGSGKKID